jgi:hypothetical protein
LELGAESYEVANEGWLDQPARRSTFLAYRLCPVGTIEDRYRVMTAADCEFKLHFPGP